MAGKRPDAPERTEPRFAMRGADALEDAKALSAARPRFPASEAYEVFAHPRWVASGGIRKMPVADDAYLRGLAHTLDEWNSPEDEAAWRDL